MRGVARFAVPAGVGASAPGCVAGYLFALHDLDLAVADARTVAVTILVACGLYLVMALEAEGSRRRSTLVGRHVRGAGRRLRGGARCCPRRAASSS